MKLKLLSLEIMQLGWYPLSQSAVSHLVDIGCFPLRCTQYKVFARKLFTIGTKFSGKMAEPNAEPESWRFRKFGVEMDVLSKNETVSVRSMSKMGLACTLGLGTIDVVNLWAIDSDLLLNWARECSELRLGSGAVGGQGAELFGKFSQNSFIWSIIQ